MKIVNELSERDLSLYDNIVAWGTGPLFTSNYRKEFVINYIIDGTGKKVGESLNGMTISAKESLKQLTGRTLVIIYSIYEVEIIEQINSLNIDVDTVIYSLLDMITKDNCRIPQINGKNAEDILIYHLIKQLEMETIQYLEIGVCHPVIRNNTFLLSKMFSHHPEYKGVLVEANPLCWDNIQDYRGGVDILIKKGISTTEGKMEFYQFPGLLGYSTFIKELAEEQRELGNNYNVVEVETQNINNVIEENFNRVPDLLALDVEGMEIDIVKDWDSEKYPFKMVVLEATEGCNNLVYELMETRGYKIYARTIENIIWLKREYYEHIFNSYIL